MAVAAFGTVVEWYDFSVFFYVSSSLATTFFGGDEGSLLLTLALGAAGFVFRPVGAMVFGHLGDRIGRRASLIVSASLMAAALAGIAVMPGSDTVGVWGGVGVLVLRCLAGFAVGAEYTGIMVYLAETARDGRRGLAASWAAANSEIGSLLAVGG
ncbi:MAG TPA: MFS transporter, partial [Corynebacterium nuruki]|nr:MFS transporter [Corynebacterium nuruki]